jgi:3-hydroxyacyl-CoA dehydrogenase
VSRLSVLGGGSIGVAFAVQFSRAGHQVAVYEPDAERLAVIPGEVRLRLDDLAEHGLLDEAPELVAGRVRVTGDVATAVAGADLVQECAPEIPAVKRALFEEAATANPDAVLASSSSAIVPSAIAEEATWAARLIVGHPGNPPYLIPVVEVVPGPATDAATVARARELYADAGLSPVVLNREIEGFIFNRLQGAVLREAYCLLRDGIADVEAIDTVMRDGLGRRWTFMGPFETSDLNVRGGLVAHAARMGAAYERMGAERGQRDPWTPDLVERADAQRRAVLPLEDWEERVRWRDVELMRRLAADRSR